MSRTRLVTLEDAPALAELVIDNRDFLAPWEPVREDDYFTEEGQRAAIGQALEAHSRGTTLPHVVLDDSGSIAGRITLSGIVHRAFQSCSVGYWVGESHNGRGVATEALRDIRRIAFGHLQLHRIEAATLLHNAASQEVLARNGFARIGLAPDYLKIAGRWQDHALFQVLNPAGG